MLRLNCRYWLRLAGCDVRTRNDAGAAPQLDDMVTRIAVGCGPGRTRVDGIVARTTVRPWPVSAISPQRCAAYE